jgi:hypothetical protein
MLAITRSVVAGWVAALDFFLASDAYVQPHRAERVLPTGTIDLVIDLTTGGTVAGARYESFLLDTAVPRELIGARFTIGGGFAFFRSAGALRDLFVPLETLMGRRGPPTSRST